MATGLLPTSASAPPGAGISGRVFESTTPPDGQRITGRAEVLEAWGQVMADATDVHFEVEEMIPSGDRVVVLWRYSWADGHIRGVDVMRVRNGQVAESFAYVKG